MANQYELTYLLTPDLSEEGVGSWIGKIAAVIGELNGTVTEQRPPKRQSLAYPIKHRQQATYVTVQFEGPTTLPPAFKERFLHEAVLLRHLIVERPRKKKPKIMVGEQEVIPMTDEKKAEQAPIPEKTEATTEEIDQRLREILGT